MATIFKEVNFNLATLINSIDIGLISLPDIKHPFIRPDSKGRDLFDSLFKVRVKGQWITRPYLVSILT